MPLFALTIFVSAFLLFQVQPVISKAILPWFGGAAGVWNTCMLFFQATLLAGYAYAHWLQSQPAARQRKVHIALLAVSLVCLPILPSASWKPAGNEEPSWLILGLLAATIGLPYFLLSTTSPLLQAWYVRANKQGVPWRLFALSNAASLGALLTYPVLVEPNFSVPQQAWIWSAAFLGFAALGIAVCWKFAAGPEPAQAEGQGGAPALGLRALWVALAACASILLLGITTYLVQDVASIPFLWIIPLAIYLLTFILSFETEKAYYRPLFFVLLTAALYVIARVLDHEEGDWSPTVAENVALCAATLFICCMVCHGELAKLKPAPKFLTGYYVSLSLGGALGGLFVGLAAPLLFNTYYELNIGLWLCAALAVIVFVRTGLDGNLRKAGALLMLIGLGIYGAWMVKIKKDEIGGVELAVRNFYGHLHVTKYGSESEPGSSRQLIHGQINHGTQLLDPNRRMEPVSYFCKTSGAGRALLTRDAKPMKVGVLGLGCGAMLGYAREGDEYRLYEINPLVFEVADSRFSFTRETKAKVHKILGDARLSLEREPTQQFDRLFMDAFSGDSIPVHLVTHEAFELYFRHLKPDGIVVVNITNSYLDLLPVVTKAAAAFGKTVVEIEDEPYEGDEECYISHYALVMSPEKLAATPELAKNSTQPKPDPNFREWTDAFSNLFAIVRR